MVQKVFNNVEEGAQVKIVGVGARGMGGRLHCFIIARSTVIVGKYYPKNALKYDLK